LPYSKVGNMERAEALVRELEEDGFEVPLDLYHTMMDGYTTVRDELKCLTVFQRLKVWGSLYRKGIRRCKSCHGGCSSFLCLSSKFSDSSS
jgi:pentatricopeptide repeat protein